MLLYVQVSAVCCVFETVFINNSIGYLIKGLGLFMYNDLNYVYGFCILSEGLEGVIEGTQVQTEGRQMQK